MAEYPRVSERFFDRVNKLGLEIKTENVSNHGRGSLYCNLVFLG